MFGNTERDQPTGEQDPLLYSVPEGADWDTIGEVARNVYDQLEEDATHMGLPFEDRWLGAHLSMGLWEVIDGEMMRVNDYTGRVLSEALGREVQVVGFGMASEGVTRMNVHLLPEQS